MPCDTEKRTDWEVCPVIDLGAAIGVGGGGWLFTFRNGVYHSGGANGIAYAGVQWDMAFLGGSLGVKPFNAITALLGKLAGLGIRAVAGRTFQPLHVLQPFSAYDLGGGLGSVGYLGAVQPVLFQWSWVAAANTDGFLFRSRLKGWKPGADLSVSAGTWQYVC